DGRLDGNAANGGRRANAPSFCPQVRAVREAASPLLGARSSVPQCHAGPPRPHRRNPSALEVGLLLHRRGSRRGRPQGRIRGTPRARGRPDRTGGGMKGLAGRRGRGLPKGARLDIVDNTGAKIVEIIAVRNWHGTHRRYPRAGIADLIIVSVKKGTP